MILILMIGINISLSLVFLSTSFNGISYMKGYLENHQYYRNVTYAESISTMHPKRDIEVHYINQLEINHTLFEEFRLGYTDRNSFLLDSEIELDFIGNIVIDDSHVIVMKSSFSDVSIGDTMKISLNQTEKIYTVSGIILDDRPFLKHNYPEIITYKATLEDVSLRTIELPQLSDLKDISLHRSINYENEYDQFLLFRNVSIITSVVLTAFFFSIVIISFSTVIKNIIHEQKQTFYLLNYLGVKRKSLTMNLFLIISIYAILAFILSIFFATFINFIVFKVIDISLLVDKDMFSSNINMLSLLIVLACLLLTTIIQTRVAYRMIRSIGDSYV